jgi:hypothetical protein
MDPYSRSGKKMSISRDDNTHVYSEDVLKVSEGNSKACRIPGTSELSRTGCRAHVLRTGDTAQLNCRELQAERTPCSGRPRNRWRYSENVKMGLVLVVDNDDQHGSVSRA